MRDCFAMETWTWAIAQQRIRSYIVPRHATILKCDGVERRLVTNNTANKISMRTGDEINQTKAITYEMLHAAFDTLQSTGRFTSADFQRRFPREYKAAPCRYSMTGGVLVEVGIAELIPGDSCDYVLKR